MRNDDAPTGRLLSRREVVALLGATGAALLAPGAARAQVPACVVRPQQTEGPYFVEERLVRADIRSDPATGEVRPGAPLQLAFAVSALRGGACAPLAGAVVDVWHCDALGAYSDVRDPGGSTVGQKFLRGAQTTDAAGLARFTTIYPGAYAGRAVHIHFKVRTGAAAVRGHEFTSQIYFDDTITDQVHALEPYARRGRQRLRNDGDGLFRSGGRQLLASVARGGQGYAAQFDLALSL
jgi:protocatechuate 3,4-dioxygenase beta subunit